MLQDDIRNVSLKVNKTLNETKKRFHEKFGKLSGGINIKVENRVF